jgi:FAD-linked oxidoreductase
MATTVNGGRWRNWSGSVDFKPREVATPRSVDELAQTVAGYAREGRHMRVTGSGHSFTPLVRSDDVLISMAGLSGITAVDAERGTVTVLGGTPLKKLGDDLLARGLAQENLGDIDVQTITGALSTGTHGTGLGFGTLSTQIAALTLVTASGDVLELSPDRDPDTFKAAQVSLGALGVVAAVTLRVVPAKRLRYQTRRERLESCLGNYMHYSRENAHFEFYWFPYTKWTQAKLTNETTDKPTGSNLGSELNRVVLENGVFWLLSAISRTIPPLSPAMCKASTLGIAATTAVGYSHHIYATPRAVRFQEMEYNIPIERFAEVMGEIDRRITRGKFRVNFPLECRFVKGDDIWLSPAYGRDSAYIAAHMFKGMPYKEYFAALEEIFQRYDGRPHWGKLHTLTAATLSQRYPHWDDFRRVRAALDPNGVFLNDYLRALLDADAPVAPSPIQVSHASVPEATPASAPETPSAAATEAASPQALETSPTSAPEITPSATPEPVAAAARLVPVLTPSPAQAILSRLPADQEGAQTSEARNDATTTPTATEVTAIGGSGSDTAAREGVLFKPGWWGTGLGRYRACDGTYCYSPYDSLPPLTNFDGTLSWLGALPDHLDAQLEVHRNDPSERGQIDALAEQARQLGLTLPPAFVELMGSSELQDRVPSCTACYFKLSERIIPCPGAEQGSILRFLNDQQDVLLWYLYLTPDGGARVIVSPYALDDGEELTDVGRANVLSQTVEAAPTFDEFIYRFWLENTIWFKLNESGATFSPDEQAYLDHYAQARGE